MQQEIAIPVDLKVLMNHIYEYKKGVRCLVLYTFNRKYESFAISRLEHQNIDCNYSAPPQHKIVNGTR